MKKPRPVDVGYWAALAVTLLTAYWQHAEKMHELKLKEKFEAKSEIQEAVIESILE
jgi:hypothetical protein